ncbi:cryptochrome/photolyase family protein [Woodsholea maritima]|uniref:cryptochrome/photolyase family protein n=1 Tax=Woodsholea maritima TaxID=240237 RepID=UPI0003783AD7|nr:deoxyribodipyrimidine photo-lyase [Woodsholea maritima]
MSKKASLVWFRQDLRIADNPALMAALERGGPISALYILDDEAPGPWARGAASRWWLHHSLKALSEDLADLGLTLHLIAGHSELVLKDLVASDDYAAIYWNRCYEPYARERDSALKSHFKEAGLEVQSFNASLIVEPWTIATQSGTPFRVFTPFWKAIKAGHEPERPLPRPSKAAKDGPKPAHACALADFKLLPTLPDWAGGMREAWTVGSSAAHGRLGQFIHEAITRYKSERNLPAKPGTSRLSPHLHFGEISPREIWWAVQDHFAEAGLPDGAWTFLSEIAWREFSYNLLYHFPTFPEANYQEKFNAFPWHKNEAGMKAWQRGQTGYPIVDAGMRELWHTGWMHNRVRMIVASFLIKHLLIDWREGEAWFWDTLVDADLANNAASWQWVAGSGADAAPYFRIFNPITQGEKFDPDGAYIRQWVPELKDLPTKYIFAPWQADQHTLIKAGITLGKTYPKPLVDHSEARNRALEAFQAL